MGYLFSWQPDIPDDKKIMRDVDFHGKSIDAARFSDDPNWMKLSINLEGPCIWGKDVDGSIHTGPPEGYQFRDYNPWVLTETRKAEEVNIFLSSYFVSLLSHFLHFLIFALHLRAW